MKMPFFCLCGFFFYFGGGHLSITLLGQTPAEVRPSFLDSFVPNQTLH